MENTRYDWRLTAFRLGALASVVLAVVIFARFDVALSFIALIVHNPTVQEVADSKLEADRKRAECLATNRENRKGTEYPPSCPYDVSISSGIPRDIASSNLWRSAPYVLLLLVGIIGVAMLGIRMARDSQTRRE